MAEVVSIASNCEILSHPRAETRLSIVLNEIHKVVDPLYFESARNFHNYLFIDSLRQSIINFKESDKDILMVKDTSMRGAQYLQQHFPDDMYILVTRDPRDTLVSLFKGMRIKDKSIVKRVLKTIGRFTGVYNYTYSRKFQKRYLQETQVIYQEGYNLFKYEDFVSKDEDALNRLLQLFNNPMPVSVFCDKIDNIHVINTSFYKEESESKSTWDAKPKSEKFKPVHRKSLRKIEMLAIELGCKKLRKQLRYIP